MKLSMDVKPIGAFIEYTLKPLIDYSHELCDILDRHNLKAGDAIRIAVKIYIVDMVFRCITSLLVTGMICYTAWLCLNTAK